jgi:uncharacterized protein
MQLVWDRDESPLAVDGIEGARIRVGGQWREQSFWVNGRQLGPWRPATLAEVAEEDLLALLEHEPGLIVLGTGERHALLPPRLMAVALTRALAARDHPLQHAQVVAEARPQELAVAPLRNQLTWKIFGSLARRGLVEATASARSSRRSCSRRTASSPSGRGAPRRPRRWRRRWSPRPSRRRPARRGSSRAPRTPAAPALARRPPKTIAEIGTPCGSSACGAVARALLRADGEARVRMRGRAVGRVVGRPCQSLAACAGQPSHHGWLSAVTPTLVKIASRWSMASAFGLVFGAGARRHAEEAGLGLIAYSRPSAPGCIQQMSSPTVQTFQPAWR